MEELLSDGRACNVQRITRLNHVRLHIGIQAGSSERRPRGSKGAGMPSVKVHGPLTGLLISHACVPKFGVVAVTAAVRRRRE